MYVTFYEEHQEPSQQLFQDNFQTEIDSAELLKL